MNFDYYDLMLRLKYLHTFAFLTLLSMGSHAADTTEADATAAAVVDIPQSTLSVDTFYELLVGEIAAREMASHTQGANLLLRAAHKIRSEAVYERAFEVALRTRSSPKVLEVIHAWVKAFPSSASANRYQLQVLLGLNRIAEIQQVLKRQLLATPIAERKEFIRQIPSHFALVKDKKLAVTMVEKAFQSELSNRTIGPHLWVAVGLLRMAAENTEGALDAYRKAVSLDANSKEATLFAIYLLEKNIPATEPMIRAYFQRPKKTKDADEPELHLVYINALWKIKHLSDAYAQTLVLLQQNPQYADGWLMRAALDMEESRYENAEPSFKAYLQLLQAAPEKEQKKERRGMMEAYAALAKITQHRQLGALGEAQIQQYLTQARELIPNDLDDLYELAMKSEKLSQFDTMEAILRQIIRLDASYYNAYNALGYSFAERNIRLPEARALIREALNLKPDDPFITDSLAWVEFRSGNPDEALRLLQSAFDAGKDAEIAAHLGEVLWSKGQIPQANAVWEQGLKINPSNTTLLETLKRLQPNQPNQPKP